MTGIHSDDAGSPARRVRAVEQLLENAGVLTGTELDEFLDRLPATSSPANGARIVARAWTDLTFRRRLLDDANSAIGELGYSGGGPSVVLRIVENTDEIHNVVVCTLCSCYPLALLGPSPSWYKSEAYRSRVVRDPRGVLAEFNFDVPDDVTINVWDANAETRYLVIPKRPPGTERLTEEELAKLVSRRGLIGTAPV
jgi:nitrile hydratase subunit alpha